MLPTGDRIYLGLSTSYERKVLHRLRVDFALLWCGIILLGALIVFISTRRMLQRVQMITDTTAAIGRQNLSSRIPITGRNDEISRLSLTLNTMLDRIESAVQQLHAMSDALAHDLRSPMTSVRGKLELALMSEQPNVREEAIAHSIEELDRISALLSTSLDVSEASADSLRLRKQEIDLSETVRSIVELYEPAFTQAGLTLSLTRRGSMFVNADAALLQRTLANLLENELKHVQAGASVTVTLQPSHTGVVLLVEDDGAGFPKMLLPHLFERYSKGPASSGRGLGLAFVAAVIRSHEGTVSAHNREQGGACIEVELRLLRLRTVFPSCPDSSKGVPISASIGWPAACSTTKEYLSMVDRKTDSGKLINALQANWIAEMQGFHIYSHLAEREKDASRRRSLRGLATSEKHHADLWADRLHALGAEVPRFDSLAQERAIQELEATPGYALRSLELDESRDIAKYGQQLQDLGDEGSVAVLSAVLRDEQEHYKLLQKLSRINTLPEDAAVGQAQSALEALLAAREVGGCKRAVGLAMQFMA